MLKKLLSIIEHNDMKEPNSNASAMSLGNEDVAPYDNERIAGEDYDCVDKRPEVYLTKLEFSDGTCIKINSNDIVIFVGANNVGKSRSLCDIYDLCGSHPDTVVVKAISSTIPQQRDILSWCRRYLNTEKGKSGETYFGLDVSDAFEYDFKTTLEDAHVSSMRGVFVCRLGTSDRLAISLPKESIASDDIPKYPIHILVRDGDLREKISKAFHEAFGCSLFPFVGNGSSLSLCTGVEPSVDKIKGKSLIDFYSDYIKIVDSIPKLHEQGDGMRSFAGLMLYLALARYNIFLIDEPEAFLHPPQATILGGILGDLLGVDRQAIVATHSIHFIKGLLEQHANRVKIVRVNRVGNVNSCSLLNNNRLVEISKDPFLNYSSLLEGMFYKNVVLCEGDADCMFYSMLNSAVDINGVKGTETLFTHCGGKQRMAKVIGALKELKVDVKVIPDFDVLNDENIVKELVQVCGGEWKQIERDYNVLISDIKQRAKVGETGADILKKISAELSDVMGKIVSQTKMRNIKEMLSSNTEWDRLKQTGMSGIGAGNPFKSCEAILNYLATIGIYVVHCGELERFISKVGGHGPNWLHNVLEKYPEVSDPVYDAAKKFVRSWGL